MANIKISGLTAVGTVVPGTDVLPLVNGGSTVKATPDAIVKQSLITANYNIGIGTTTPTNNKVQINGAFSRGVPVTKTADFTLAATENWIIVNKGSTCNVTLPAASAWPGREVTIKTIQAFTVVSVGSVVVPITETAVGSAILPGTDGAWATLVSDGTNWVIMAKG